MADWVHCNLCGQVYAKGISFIITTCSHIFCQRCKEKGTDPCAICRNSCKLTELNSNLDRNMQTYFSNPEDLLKKCQEVMKFQEQHRAMLTGHLKKKVDRQAKVLKSAEDYCKKQNDEIKQLKYDNSVLKKYINSFKANVAGYSNYMPTTPRQLLQSPNMASSPRHSRCIAQSPHVNKTQTLSSQMMAQSPATPVPMTPRHLTEIQNTPDQDRLSIRPRTKDGRIGTPSPHTFAVSYSTNSSRIASPLVASADANYKYSSALQQSSSMRKVSSSNYAKEIWPTPPCTPKKVSSSSGVKSTYFSKIEASLPRAPHRQPFVSKPTTPQETPLRKYSNPNFR